MIPWSYIPQKFGEMEILSFKKMLMELPSAECQPYGAKHDELMGGNQVIRG